MAIELVVTQSFGARKKGEVITDQDEIETVLDANAHCVVRRAPAAPDPQPAQPAPKP